MFGNYFSITLRRLFRNKLHTSINLVGLFIGFTIGIMVLLAVYGQFSYDRDHVNRKRIFMAYQFFNKPAGEETGNVFGYPAAPTFKAEVPAIEKATRFMYGSNSVLYNDKEVDVSTMMVDEDFLKMFTYTIVRGNKVSPLQSLTDVVITEGTAKKIFGKEDPIGKSIRSSYGGKEKEMTVVAVLKDFANNTSIRFDALTRIENNAGYASDKNKWDNQHHSVFIQNAEKHTHGFNAADLSLGPYRNAVIINSMLGRDYYPVDGNTAFQHFGMTD